MAYQMKINTDEVMDWVNRQPYREYAKRAAMSATKNETLKKTTALARKHSTTGRLERSLIGTSNAKGFQIKGLMYGDIVLEYGRGPGGKPPLQNLREWVDKKMSVSPSESWIIARTLQDRIAQEGTKKYREGGPREISWIEKWLNREFLPKKLDKLARQYTE